MKVKIDYTEGQYVFSKRKDGDVDVPDDIWEGYLAHCLAIEKWQRYICALDNKMYEEKENVQRSLRGTGTGDIRS